MPLPGKEQTWSTPRAFRRFLLDIRVIVRAAETFHGRTKDMGEGGVGATIPGSIAGGETVELEFQLPGMRDTMRLKAEVRYRQGFQYGFKFLHATDHQREIIRRATKNLPLAP